MANLMKVVNHDLRAQMTNLITALETDADVLAAAPMEDVRATLRAVGIDAKRFQGKVVTTLAVAKVRQVGDMVLKWVSPVWQPQWAGQLVTAGDIPEQTRTFAIPHGQIEIRCNWKPASHDMPAYLELAWHANTVMTGELWCRFMHPETYEVLAEISFGTHQDGGKYLTTQALGFDPSHEPWAISVLIKEHATA